MEGHEKLVVDDVVKRSSVKNVALITRSWGELRRGS